MRIADIGDAKELKRLNDAFNGSDCNTVEGIREGINRNEAETVFVAESHNKLLGFCCGQLIKSICYNVFYAEITELYIDYSYRRQRIGSNLIRYAEGWFRQQGVYNFQLLTGQNNVIAQKFYEHLGYSRQNEISYRKEADT